MFVLLMVMITGYGAFNTNIGLSAKGNVYDKGDLCYETSNNGDGTVTITNYDKTCGSYVIIPSTIKGKTVTKIGSIIWGTDGAFFGKGLTKVVIPDTVTYIGNCAFANNAISDIDFGNGLEEIGYEAFHINNLTSIVFPKTLKIIGYGAFLRNYLTSIPPLDNIKYGGGAFSENSLKPETAFIYDRNDDGSIDYTSLNSYAARQYVAVLNIPDGVKKLSFLSLRFSNAGTINLPEGLEVISESAFHQSYVKVVNIPSSVKSIGSLSFAQTDNLTEINIDKPEGFISGSPWGASKATVNWNE